MILFALPQDERLQAAVGKVAIRHGQLEYTLRMTVKSVVGLSVQEALDATHRQGSQELRESIRKLARRKLGEVPAMVRLRAMLTRCERLTKRRNELLHGLWAQELDGPHVFRHDDQTFHPQPTVEELETLANDMAAVASEIHDARLNGFLKEALDLANNRNATRSPVS